MTDATRSRYSSETVRIPAPGESELQTPGTRSPKGRRPTKLTVRLLETLQPGERVRDTVVRGLFAECGERGVSLKIQGDLSRGNSVRMTLGRFPELGLDAARTRAMALLADIRAGKDPRKPATSSAAAWTVGTAIERYVADMGVRECAERCIKFTGARLKNHLSAWWDRPIVEVLPSDCQAAHERITASSGKVAANKVLRDFRAAWNHAHRKADRPEQFPGRCPAESVTFHRERRREGAVIPKSELPKWYAKVQALPNPVRREMHVLGLLSGLRPGNLVALRREWIDLERRAIAIPAGEMKARKEFLLPLSSAMVDVVQRALAAGDLMFPGGRHRGWLFPAWDRAGKEVIATRVWREKHAPLENKTPRTLASNECGHALRHTYRTLAAAAGVVGTDAELLLAHALPGVSGTYLHQSQLHEHLVVQQERISAYIVRLLGSSA